MEQKKSTIFSILKDFCSNAKKLSDFKEYQSNNTNSDASDEVDNDEFIGVYDYVMYLIENDFDFQKQIVICMCGGLWLNLNDYLNGSQSRVDTLQNKINGILNQK